jgi:Flp pilus assembly protein CpaB
MKRLRTPLIILGLLGAVVVAVAVVLVVRVGRGTPVELPVAISDIPPGAALEPQLFRLEEVRGLDTGAYVTKDEFAAYVGYPTLETVHAGFPVGKAQVRTDDPNLRQGRLTLLLSDEEGDEDHLVYPLAVTPDQVGNYLVPGDHVDVIFTLGRAAANQIEHVEEVEAPPLPGASNPSTPTVPAAPVVVIEYEDDNQYVTTTLDLPLAKVILPDVPVLRVEREQIRTASASYGLGGAESTERVVQGDVQRIYLEIDREQAEVLSFALHNGALNLPARVEPVGGHTEGYTWDDFVDSFFADRPQEELRGED